MKPYVHLQGAGQGATVITSTISTSWLPTQATLVLASDASLRDLTVSNSGTGDRNVGILATAGVKRTLTADVTARAHGGGVYNYAIFLTGSGTGVTLQQVSALAENGSSSNWGLYNFSGAASTLLGGTFTGRGGTYAFGIYNGGSDTKLEAESITALGENGSNENFGLTNYLSTATLLGGSFTGRGGTTAARGISNRGSGATLEAKGVTALGKNNSEYNFGLGNYDGAVTVLRSGSFIGRGGTQARGIYNADSDTTLDTESVTALAENGSSGNRGLDNNNSAEATLRGGSFTGSGGISAIGINNADSGTTLDTESVTALGVSGGNNYGLFTTGIANVTQSMLEGHTFSVFQTTNPVTVTNSVLVDGAVSGTVTCVLVTRGTTISTDGVNCP